MDPAGWTHRSWRPRRRAGQLVVVEGYPRYVTQKKHRTIVLILVGKVLVPMPVEVHYDGYHLFATSAAKGTPASLVVKRPRARLAEGLTRFGGAIRPCTFGEGSDTKSGVFLEPLYFTALS